MKKIGWFVLSGMIIAYMIGLRQGRAYAMRNIKKLTNTGEITTETNTDNLKYYNKKKTNFL